MQDDEEVESGSARGEMEAGLQMETGAALLLTAGIGVLEGGVYWPLAPLSELASRMGEPFFLTGRAGLLLWAPLCDCWACWRHLARLFLNQT